MPIDLASILGALGTAGVGMAANRRAGSMALGGGEAATPEQIEALRKIMGAKHVSIVPPNEKLIGGTEEAIKKTLNKIPVVGKHISGPGSRYAGKHVRQAASGPAYMPGSGSKAFGGKTPGKLEQFLGRGSGSSMYWGGEMPPTPRQLQRGYIVGQKKMPLGILAHEFGHATGRGKLMQLQRAGKMMAQYAPTAGMAIGGVTGGGAQSRLGAAVKGGLGGGAAGLAAAAAVLPEEIRASWRAIKALEKMPGISPAQLSAAKKQLLAASFSYLTGTATAPIATGVGAGMNAYAKRTGKAVTPAIVRKNIMGTVLKAVKALRGK